MATTKQPSKPASSRPAASEKVAAQGSPPAWIEPCQPTLVDRPPVGAKWRHEVKWDGYRLCVVLDAGKATVRTRRGHDWAHRFTSIAAAATALPCQNAVIDGEAVVLDERGHASFSALQPRLDGESRADVVLYAFDLLFLDGHDLRDLLLSERRAALEGLISSADRVKTLKSGRRVLRDSATRRCKPQTSTPRRVSARRRLVRQMNATLSQGGADPGEIWIVCGRMRSNDRTLQLQPREPSARTVRGKNGGQGDTRWIGHVAEHHCLRCRDASRISPIAGAATGASGPCRTPSARSC